MSDTSSKGQRPVYEIQDGALKLSIWKQDGAHGPFYTITCRRRYKDKSTDEWKDAASYNEADALPMAELFRDAYAWIRMQRRADAKTRKETDKAVA